MNNDSDIEEWYSICPKCGNNTVLNRIVKNETGGEITNYCEICYEVEKHE